MPDLHEALTVLRAHEQELRARGVKHAAIFGSVARGDTTAASDLDILIDLDPDKPIGLFDYAGIKLYLAEIFGIPEDCDGLDMANRRTLKPLLRDAILRDAIDAF
jgi:predicted nucleotidyltransferase